MHSIVAIKWGPPPKALTVPLLLLALSTLALILLWIYGVYPPRR